jgi:ABC-2 type transport system permease protein
MGEVNDFLDKNQENPSPTAKIVLRMKFNPNLTNAWFMSMMELIDSLTMVAIILAGGALMREREHKTIDHLVMPLHPDMMLAKVWANGLVILVRSVLAPWVVVQGILQIPIAGSIPLFVTGAVLYLFSATALGIFLATLSRSMPQFGLLSLWSLYQ